jgi:hypothetical protein
VLRGPRPEFRGYGSWHDEVDGILQQVREWQPEDGTAPVIGVAVPERRQVTEVESYLNEHGILATTIGADGPRRPDAVHVGTLHRFKGLEYQQMMVAGISAGTIPATRVEGLRTTDPQRYEREIKQARSLRVILDRYELVTPIASGGMGTLWEGTDRRLNRKIVVKLILPGKRRDSAAMRRFNREARITARLGHPGVPVLYDFGTDQGELFMAIEHVSGVTIADLIAEVVPVPVPWAAAIVAQVCAVLAAAHEQQLVHRDLKPSNVMIRPDGSVKVLDFGLAAALSSGEFSQITRAGELPGTASYMAPEVAAGEPAESASDLYSMGCLFYELLTLPGEEPSA